MKPKCKYFGVCGGCQHQDVPYQQQIHEKEQFLSTLFHQDVSVYANPDPYNYRNRMDFFVSPTKLGLKAQGDYSTIVDIDRCEIQHEKLNTILKVVRNWVKKHDLRGARPGEFEGFLRFAMIRGDDNQQQLTLTTTNTQHEALVDELAQTLDLVSLVWTVENTSTERSVGTQTHKVYGKETITLALANKEFIIDSHTFFQTSPKMAEIAIQKMREFVNTNTVYDLYCGVGIIGQCLADKVIGVDNNPSNIQQAKRNAQNNNILAEYHCSDAAAWMLGQNPQLVIVDPPRTGLQTGVHTLLAARPKRILYLSCNPKTQARDLIALKTKYEIIHLQGFDFFAHTNHVECLVVLERKD